MDEPSNKRNLPAEIAGWYGMSAIVLAYILLSFNIVSNGTTYQILNLSGAAGIITISIVKKVRQSLVLNLFWGTFAILALIKIWFR